MMMSFTEQPQDTRCQGGTARVIGRLLPVVFAMLGLLIPTPKAWAQG